MLLQATQAGGYGVVLILPAGSCFHPHSSSCTRIRRVWELYIVNLLTLLRPPAFRVCRTITSNDLRLWCFRLE